MKCSFVKCNKQLSVEKREVYFVKFFRKSLNDAGKEEILCDGHRSVCKDHFNFINNRRIRKPFVSLLKGEKYEPAGKRTNHFRPKGSNKVPAKAHDTGVRANVAKSEVEVSGK